MGSVLAIAAFAVLILALSGAGSAGAAATPSYDSDELRFLRLINEYRQTNGLEPLILSDALAVAAERHSEDQGRYGFFAHDTVRSSYYPAGSTPWDRMAAEGYDYNTYRGENIAVGYETAEEAFDAWRNSPSHNSAMLDGRYRVIGIARVYIPNSEYGWYWTTDFGAEVDPSAHAPGERAGAPEKKPAGKPVEKAVAGSGDSGRLENGGMDGDAVWKQQAKDGKALILDGGFARLGGYNDGVDDLRQKIWVGKNTRLTYDLQVAAFKERRPSDDRLLVRLTNWKGETFAVLKTYTRADAGGWRREEIDLSRFAGRMVYLSFHARTDETVLTTFRIDDVGLER